MFSSVHVILIVALTFFISLSIFQMKKNPGYAKRYEMDLSISPRFIFFLSALLFAFAAIIMGVVLFISYHYDGSYIFFDRKSNLNQTMLEGNVPEAGTYATIRFNVIGEAFYPYNGEGVFYPVVLFDEDKKSEKKVVCGLYVSDEENETVIHYKRKASVYLAKENGEDTFPALEYSGRISYFEKNMDLYKEAVADSGFDGDKYVFTKYFLNARESREKMKNDFQKMFMLFWVCIFGEVLTIALYILLKKRKAGILSKGADAVQAGTISKGVDAIQAVSPIYEENRVSDAMLNNIRVSAENAVTYLNDLGYNATYDLESMKEIDRFFDDESDNKNDLSSEVIFGIASLVGETILRLYGGRWLSDENDPEDEMNIEVRTSVGVSALPVQKCMKRMVNGQDDSIYIYVLLLEKNDLLSKNLD